MSALPFQYIFQESVHMLCALLSLTSQLQNYSSLWMITYQENGICPFVSVYAGTERLPWLVNFLVSLLGSKRSLLNVSLHTVSFIEKCWLVEKCHLNLTFLRMWLKLSTTLKYMALTNVCSHSSVRRWTQSTHLLYTEVRWLSKGRSLATVLELWEPPQRFLL